MLHQLDYKALVKDLLNAARAIDTIHNGLMSTLMFDRSDPIDDIHKKVLLALSRITPLPVVANEWVGDIINSKVDFETFWNKYYEGRI